MTHWAAKYIGQEWVSGENDCWAFFRKIERDEFGVEVPEVDISATDVAAYVRAFNEHEERAHWYEVSEPLEGDAVLMTRGRYPSHIGVWVGEGGVLHSVKGYGVVFQTLSALRREWSHLTFYRHR